MCFRGSQLLITTGAPCGEGTNLQQNNTQSTALALNNPHIHTPGMLSYSSSTAGHAHATSMHRMVTVPFDRTETLYTHARMSGVMLAILNSCSPIMLNIVEFAPPTWALYLSTTMTLTCRSERMARAYAPVRNEALQPKP